MSSTPSPQLRIESRLMPDGAVRLAVTGEIDLATADGLRATLLGAVRAGPPRAIQVDLTGVTFLDCYGLSVLVTARQAATRAGRSLRIIGPQRTVRRVLEMTGLLGVLTSDPMAARPFPEAIRSVNGGFFPKSAPRRSGLVALSGPPAPGRV